MICVTNTIGKIKWRKGTGVGGDVGSLLQLEGCFVLFILTFGGGVYLWPGNDQNELIQESVNIEPNVFTGIRELSVFLGEHFLMPQLAESTLNNRFNLFCRRTMKWIAAVAGLFLILVLPQDTEAFPSVSTSVSLFVALYNTV